METIAIPEILIKICKHLQRNDLLVCVLLNSTWFQICTPYLWRTIDCTLDYERDQKPHIPDEIQEQAFTKYSAYIHTVRTNSLPLVTTVLKHCTHLRHIRIPYCRRNPFTSARFVKNTIGPAMERNQGLESLDYHLFPIPPVIHGGTLPLLKIMLEPLRSLTSLSISFHDSIQCESFGYLLKFAKQLHKFEISTEAIAGYVRVELEPTQLRGLKLKSSLVYQEELYLIPLLKASPSLSELQLPLFSAKLTTLITQTIREYCPRLRHLTIDGYIRISDPHNLQDDNIADLIDSCRLSGLVKITIPNRKNFGQKSLQALCGHHTTLESVCMSNYHVGTTQIVQKLLTLCPSLRILDTALRRSDDYILGQFPVRELLKEPWVCTKLEVFRVVIEKVVGGYTIGEDGNENEVDEYADQDVYAYLSPYSDEEYTRRRKQEELENQERRRRRDRVRANMVPYDCHREFYTQISKLMRLEELNVGFGRWSGRHCESAPKFSIESGLELLEGLKQLRILNVANTKNDIQRQELEWMCEHWPNLESIEGLYRPKVASWWSLEGASSIPAKVENVLM